MTHMTDPAILLLLGMMGLVARGLNKHALEFRRTRRICPSCGLHIHRHRCGCTR